MKRDKIMTRAKKGKAIRQVAALPFRWAPDGSLQILMVTSRETRRFIIPKGWPMKRLKDWDAAAREAAEEAGVEGKAARHPLGRYTYWKRLKDSFVPILVDVYPVEVQASHRGWKESKQRSRAWVPASEAWTLVDEPELMTLLKTFAGAEDEAGETEAA